MLLTSSCPNRATLPSANKKCLATALACDDDRALRDLKGGRPQAIYNTEVSSNWCPNSVGSDDIGAPLLDPRLRASTLELLPTPLAAAITLAKFVTTAATLQGLLVNAQASRRFALKRRGEAEFGHNSGRYSTACGPLSLIQSKAPLTDRGFTVWSSSRLANIQGDNPAGRVDLALVCNRHTLASDEWHELFASRSAN